jgi:hypothetical protein
MFVSSVLDIASFRIQLTLSVLGDNLISLRSQIYLRLYEICCIMCLDLSKECLNTFFGEAVCEICISQSKHLGSLRTDQVYHFVSEIKNI